ncbi:MAG: aromatic amino acid lyase, partial [Phycisphaerales bacterium]
MASAPERREPVVLDGRPLTIAEVVDVARAGRGAALAPSARAAMQASRAALERCTAGGEALYGINPGFGSLSRVRIPAGDLAALQVNLIRSHAAGVGDPLDAEVVRAMMLVLAASLARGRSAVRPEVIELVLAMLAAGVVPVVPSRGSVGA